MFILSFFFWKDKKIITVLSTLTLLGLGFQAWLGKTVVDSNLAPYKITLHMIMALIIVAMILYVIFKSKTTFKTLYTPSAVLPFSPSPLDQLNQLPFFVPISNSISPP